MIVGRFDDTVRTVPGLVTCTQQIVAVIGIIRTQIIFREEQGMFYIFASPSTLCVYQAFKNIPGIDEEKQILCGFTTILFRYLRLKITQWISMECLLFAKALLKQRSTSLKIIV